MSSQALLLLPAISAPGYVLAALFLKRALSAGCSQGQVNLFANLVPALLFQPLWLWAGAVDWTQAWRPGLCALTFLVGQIFTFRALRAGEVSVATPLLGTKVVLIAIFSALLFGQAITARWWLGAMASAAGVMLVTGARWRAIASRLGEPDAMYSLGAAASFALTDILVQHWTRDLGVPVFVPLMFGMLGAASLLFFAPGAGMGIMRLARPAFLPLGIGSLLLGVQALGMAVALGLHESATAVNIVYSSRAVWSVVLAWALARSFRGEEMRDAPGVMARRLAGAFLIFGAVLAVLI